MRAYVKQDSWTFVTFSDLELCEGRGDRVKFSIIPEHDLCIFIPPYGNINWDMYVVPDTLVISQKKKKRMDRSEEISSRSQKYIV